MKSKMTTEYVVSFHNYNAGYGESLYNSFYEMPEDIQLHYRNVFDIEEDSFDYVTSLIRTKPASKRMDNGS